MTTTSYCFAHHLKEFLKPRGSEQVGRIGLAWPRQPIGC